MPRKLIDFDDIFAAYLNRWYAENKDKYADYGALEEAAGGVYGDWADMPLAECGGVSARRYFETSAPEELVRMLIGYAASDMSPPDLLIERLAAAPECHRWLLEIARRRESAELTALAVNILTGDGADGCGVTELLCDWIFDENCNGEPLDLAVEKLIERIGEAAPALLRRMTENMTGRTERALADILVYAPRDERIYALLLHLFNGGGDRALYASYLGKYGDARALPALVEFGKRRDINYLEFIEARNAAETLGGALENKKDWTQDEYYRALKGLD